SEMGIKDPKMGNGPEAEMGLNGERNGDNTNGRDIQDNIIEQAILFTWVIGVVPRLKINI
ncbi:hypothetical protein ACJX0J_007266, partial [Zea mays]